MSSPPAKSPSPAKSPASPAKSPSGPKSSVSPAKSETPLPAATPTIPETAPLAADENPDEDRYDLGIDVGAESDTASLRSSILKYREENGRTYHAYKDGRYLFPNDDFENDRLDLQHTIFLQTFDGRLHVSDVKKPLQRVLDAGCGTGLWSIEFADENPDAEITGIDLSPIQPAFVPPNCHFFVDDIEDDWNFSAPFDFVFARFMTGSVADWPRFFRQAYDNLTPGGTIELQDIVYPILSDDGTLTEDSPLSRWNYIVNEAFRAVKRPMDTALLYEQQLADAGFVDIGVVKEKWPTNRWPRDKKYKQIGIWNQENLVDAIHGVSAAVLMRPKEEGGLGWSKIEHEVLLSGVRQDLRNTNIHAYWRIDAVYARKPN